MEEFIPYIELLDYFREFETSLQTDLDQNDHAVCRTYQSYCSCLRSIIDPVYEKLCDLEEDIRQQGYWPHNLAFIDNNVYFFLLETTYTLLKLADELKTIFKPVKILKGIHDEVVLDPSANSPLKCATTLIVRLHQSLNFTADKLEQDLKLTLFLETVYHYVGLVDSWLMKNDFSDYAEEFVIEKWVYVWCSVLLEYDFCVPGKTALIVAIQSLMLEMILMRHARIILFWGYSQEKF